MRFLVMLVCVMVVCQLVARDDRHLLGSLIGDDVAPSRLSLRLMRRALRHTRLQPFVLQVRGAGGRVASVNRAGA